jgi:DNA-binding NtrC family response regulator
VNEVIARSGKMGLLLRHMRATAQSDKPTLMLGASGSGRSFLGKCIHEMSPRKDKPLVEISCLEPLLSKSLIASAERARGGTLLVTDLDRLDEHGQRELRYVLAKCSEWDRPPRLVTTALPELEVLAKKRLFMRSLYDQVAVLRHQIPSLRERFDDLPELCGLLLAEHSCTEDRAAPELLPEGLAALRNYAWPGNVRELSNILLQVLLWSSGPIDGEAVTALLPDTIPDDVLLPIGTSLAEAEQALILATLHASRGNKQATANRLGITRRTLYLKLSRYEKPGLSQAPRRKPAPDRAMKLGFFRPSASSVPV